MAPFLIGIAFLISFAAEQSVVLVQGTVRDTSGAPIPNAGVYLRGTGLFAATGLDGRFVLAGAAHGDFILVASHAGFQASELRIAIGDDPLARDMVLQLQPQIERIEVSADAPSLDPTGSVNLQPLDIYRTPGSDADPMRALQMMPGLVKIDEGAGLFVRGGDVSETLTYLDRALVYHPYRYETPTGGFFGAVDPFQISGLSLSTGAFPARYGNALSGILELTGLDRPRQLAIYGNLGLGATSASLALPLGSRWGLRISGNQSLSRLLFAVNPGSQQFEKYPTSSDFNFSLYADYARAGEFQFSLIASREQVGVETQQNSFTGILSSRSSNRLNRFHWRRNFGHWRLAAVVSHGAWRQSELVGVLNLDSQDSGSRARLDTSRSAAGWTLRAGIELERQSAISRGTIPIHGGDLGGIQGAELWSIDLAEWRFGAYAEFEHAIGRWTANLGMRFDRFQSLGASVADPRASIAYSLRKQRVRLAWGVYRQAPSPAYLNVENGNPRLRPMRAQNLVAGYEWGEENGRQYLRVEGYVKRYWRLPLEDAGLHFNDRGSGFARGVDLFWKMAAARWQAWASYSYLEAMRLYTPFNDYQQYPVPSSRYRPEFDIPHTVQLVAHRSITEMVSAGASLRLASGKPFTPVLGGYDTPYGPAPVYGDIGSGRMPLYARLDLSLSRTCHMARQASAVVYLGVSNVTGRHNVFAYAYSADYLRRAPAEGAWGRSFYFGVTVQR